MVGNNRSLVDRRCLSGDRDLCRDTVGCFHVWNVGVDIEFALENRTGGIPGVLCITVLCHHADWSSIPEN